MNDKIRKFLNQEYLVWAIIDSLPQPKLVSLMSRLGINYPGVRITSLSIQDLAYDLAGDAFKHDNIMRFLANSLNEANLSSSSIISRMTQEEISSLIDNPSRLYTLGKPGNVIWTLVSDPRPEINELTKRLLQFIEARMQKGERDFEKTKEAELTEIVEKVSSKTGNKKILRVFDRMKKEVKCQEKVLAQFILENKRLQEKNTQQQQMMAQLRKDCGEFAQEKGHWAKQLVKKEELNTRINCQIEELKRELTVGPKMRLKAEIHRLQKENDKLKYTLEKQAQENSAIVRGLEKHTLELKDNFIKLDENNQNLSRQLAQEKDKCVRLQQEYRLLPAKKEPVPLKEGKRLGIFIDNQNVYYSAKMHFNKKLDYTKFLGNIVRDRHLVKAICYVVQQYEGEQTGFITMLKNNGYMVRIRELIRRADGSAKGNWDIGIAADVMTMVDKNSLDIVVLVTCDGDFSDLAKLLVAKGIRVEVVGFTMNMAMDLKKSADEYYFISEDLMTVRTEREQAKQQ